jgi:integrase/recombinase XerD
MKTDYLSYYVQQFFIKYLKAQRGYGINTTSSYSMTFSLFIRFIGSSTVSKLKLKDLKKQTVTDFLDWLQKERNNSDSSRNVRLAHLKSFFEFVLIEEPSWIDTCSSMAMIPFKKVPRKPPVSLSEETVKEILNIPGTDTARGLKHSALLAVLYDSACRVQEIIDLKVENICFGKHCRVGVNGKGNKHRDIPLLEATSRLLKAYIKKFKLDNGDLLFESRTGGRMTRQGVSYILNKYASQASCAKTGLINNDIAISPHIFRHSKATHLVNAGVHIFNVRDFLGHESVATTQVYLTSNAENTRKAIERAASRVGIQTKSSYSESEIFDLEQFLQALR